MKKIQTIINIVLIALILFGQFYLLENYTILNKTLLSLCFALIGVNCFVYQLLKKGNFAFAILLLIGIIVAFVADIVLEIDFIIGAAIFAVGHIFYFISYCFNKKFDIKDILICTAFAVTSVLIILFVPVFRFYYPIYKYLVIAYAVIISFMLGKAFSNFVFKPSWQNAIILLGSALFFFSDLMILFGSFSAVAGDFTTLCITTYYPAQILLALSMFFIKQNNNPEIEKQQI